MKRFLVNKYPVKCYGEKGKEQFIKIGTIFTVDSIDGTFINIKPIKKTDSSQQNIMCSPEIVRIGFNEQEQVD